MTKSDARKAGGGASRYERLRTTNASMPMPTRLKARTRREFIRSREPPNSMYRAKPAGQRSTERFGSRGRFRPVGGLGQASFWARRRIGWRGRPRRRVHEASRPRRWSAEFQFGASRGSGSIPTRRTGVRRSSDLDGMNGPHWPASAPPQPPWPNRRAAAPAGQEVSPKHRMVTPGRRLWLPTRPTGRGWRNSPNSTWSCWVGANRSTARRPEPPPPVLALPGQGL
jgi:hypothetical protein